MKKFLRYLIFYLWCLPFAGNLWANAENVPGISNTALQEKIINPFQNSLGIAYPEENDSLLAKSDSLLSMLDAQHRYDTYFELARIIIKSYILKGETRLATAQSDRMYSKAKAMDHLLGQALALNSMGEVFSFTGRNDKSGDAYYQSLQLFDKSKKSDHQIKILLIELLEYELHKGDMPAAKKILDRLNHYPLQQQPEQEQAVRHIFNAFYQLQNGHITEARNYLDETKKLKSGLVSGVNQYFLLAEAVYLNATGKQEDALNTYEQFFKTESAKNNTALYIIAMKNRAKLLENLNHKKEASEQYYAIYKFIKSTFDKNYPKEIDQLSTRFQAEQLTHENEKEQSLSMRYRTIGIIVCVLTLLLFSFLSWKKIFRLKQSKQKLEDMKLRAEKAIQKKNLFLSNMSHEVRTPLNAIVGFSTLMANDDIETDEIARKEYCDIIKVNSYQLLNLINDIIDITDFEDDNIKFNIKEYNAVKICTEVIETMLASNKLNVDLRFESELTRLTIETDDSRLRQVLINLLVNATKFTKEGSIVLKLELSKEAHQTAVFTVTDTGCGIPPEKQQQIFERFEKLSEVTQGSGLGLSICQLIIKHVHGHIWIDPLYTQGARFCFTHPLKYKSASTN